MTSHDVVARVRRAVPRAPKGERVNRVGHAGTLDPFATGTAARAARPRHARPALPDGAGEDLRGRGALRRRLDDRRPGGGADRDGRRARPGDLVLPTGRLRQRPPAYSAIRVDGRRAYARARAGEDGRGARARRRGPRVHASCGATATAAPFASAAARGPTSARSSPTSATPTARRCAARRSARSRSRTPTRRIRSRWPTPWPSCPRSSSAPTTPAAPATGSRCPVRPTAATVRLVGPDGLVALAEPREDGTLKPVVGLVG